MVTNSGKRIYIPAKIIYTASAFKNTQKRAAKLNKEFRHIKNMQFLDPHTYTHTVQKFNSLFNIVQKKPDLPYLCELIGHFAKFPYENLSKIVSYQQHFNDNSRIRLPDQILEEYRLHGLGGTCFSLTFFFYTILIQNGYTCYPVLADMRSGQNVHCAVIVLLNNLPYLVDPGYLLHQPMEITFNKPRLFKSPVSGVELLHVNHQTFDLYTFNKSQNKWRYRFKNTAIPLDAFLTHWLDSFKWNSMHGFCLTKVEKDRMFYVHKFFMRETNFSTKKNHNIKKNYHQAINEVFGISPQYIEEALSALSQNIQRAKNLGLWKPKKSWDGHS